MVGDVGRCEFGCRKVWVRRGCTRSLAPWTLHIIITTTTSSSSRGIISPFFRL